MGIAAGSLGMSVTSTSVDSRLSVVETKVESLMQSHSKISTRLDEISVSISRLQTLLEVIRNNGRSSH